ncbi:MAG: tRNA dihydrouridine synthase DusB [Acholeplasmatales bacterium]|nr:tRNA dihydrouridine synthase DusB [Acholeplasmatales bacterium]
MEWKIRDITIKNQFVLAPMVGVTNEAFRIICKKMNAGLVMAEMVSDKAIGFKNERTLGMTKVNPIEHPISMQIFGGDKDSLVNAAKYIDLNSDADIIDINMGCPVLKVIKSGSGSALLKDPDKIYDVVKAVVEAVKKPVTVKIRIGWDMESINCVEVAKKIEAAGASAITVHGRTRSQFYSGTADWKYIKMVKEAVKIPVVGNGDVTSIETAKKMLEETGCDAVAIARGALGNPFLFRELVAYFDEGKIIDRPNNKEIYETILWHHELLLGLKGAHLALLEMRSHVAWYLKGMPGSARIKDLCNRQTNFDDVSKIIKEYLKI